MIPIRQIQEQFSAEVALVVLCCRVYTRSAEAKELVAFISKSAIDWQFVSKLALQHSIRPYVYEALLQCANEVPEAILQAMRKQCLQLATSNLDHLKELTRIINAFNEKNIPIVPYKGLVLGEILHGNYTTRESSDIDLLILPQDFARARNLFIELGYTDRLFFDPRFEDYFIRTDREYKFTISHAGKKINIELQWQPLHDLMGIPLSNEQLFGNLRSASVCGTQMQLLTLPQELLLLVAHHGVADVWRKLKHIMDLALFVQRYQHATNWEYFAEEMVKYRLSGFGTAGFYLAEALFGIIKPSSVPSVSLNEVSLLAGTLQYPLLSTEKKNIKHLKRHFLLYNEYRQQVSFIKRYIALWLRPNMRDIEGIYLSKPLFPLYYVIRRFRFLRGPLKKK